MKLILAIAAPLLILFFAFRPINVITVSGTISDQTGSVLSGISVSVKGKSKAVTSSSKGTYRIVVSSRNDVLLFSGANVTTVEEPINGREIVNVTLTTGVLQQEIYMRGVETSKGLKRKERSLNYSPVALADAYMNTESGFYSDRDEEKRDFNREGYDNIQENTFRKVKDNPLSTFSIDVDAASYSNVRRFLNQGQLPPAGAVRIEEMINYFKYDYPQPVGEHPFSINTEMSIAPWNTEHRLVLIGLQGKKIPTENLPPTNLTFLIDVSGSMESPEKLGLVKASMKMLVDQLREQDKVSIVVYAGAAGLVLAPTSGANKSKIKDAIDNLQAGGSTAGGEGIKLAYKTARENLVKAGNNRVILCTDGDFNVGESSDDAMERLIEDERKSGVFLTVLGYGMGNYQDAKMQKLADKGNGNHAYIDGISEARKVLVSEFGGTLFTIAKDVKLQVEFNPSVVQAYRLIGYENRMLANEDFNDDKKDAGELGSGHTVTALYEVIPIGVKSSFVKDVDPLKYQKGIPPLSTSKQTDEILTVKFRYKAPDGNVSKLIEHPVLDGNTSITSTSDNFRFAAAVAQFGLLVRGSEFKGNSSFESIITLAKRAKGVDEEGYRSEFVRLVESASLISRNRGTDNGKSEKGTD